MRYRVGIAFPLQILGSDDNGQQFSEPAVTQFIMRDGVTLCTQRRLGAGEKIRVKVMKDTILRGHVVGQTGITKSGNVYAVAIHGDPASLWGINFPELSDNDRIELTCVLGCRTCQSKSVVQLTTVEHELLTVSERVRRHCETCGQLSNWTRVPNGPNDLASSKNSGGANRRRYSRVSVKLWGYIVEGGREDSVPIVDMSRDGIRFRSVLKYEVDQVVQVAVAYMAGTANIFVPGRVVWRSADAAPEYEYGLRFMSRSPIM